MKTTFQIKKGLDLRIAGQPEQQIFSAPPVQRVALLGPDYLGLRPALEVAEGDRVKLAQVLLRDRRDPRICFTSPGAGKVVGIHRGAKRALQSVEIALDGEAEERFTQHPLTHLPNLPRELVVDTLLGSGLWPALQRRPFGRIPDPDEIPSALFVTAIDSQPLAADPNLVIAARQDDFLHGLQILERLTDGPIYLCQGPNAEFPAPAGVTRVTFTGPHPAGLVGTHIHFLHPVNLQRCVWQVGYQDVIAIGHLFTQGRFLAERVIALGGPGMKQPRLIRSRLGAAVADLLADELTPAALRIISGSALDGRSAEGPRAFLGRYHLQITALREATKPRLLGWLSLRAPESSVRKLFTFGRPRSYSTSTHGAQRAIYSIGTYEQVMPLDLSASYLLRALASGDLDDAQELGCLELLEEDLALCSFVCPGKNDYGSLLRQVLDRLEREV